MSVREFTSLKWPALLAASLLLAACGTTPPQPEESTEPLAAAPEIAADVEREPAPPGFDSSAPLQNPYQAQAPEVAPAATAAFAAAVAAMKAQNWQEAERRLRAMTADFPELSGPWLNLGIVYRALERPEDAQAALRKAIAVNAYNLEAYNQLALLQREAGHFEAAEALYLRAIETWPRHAASHRNLGILYDLYLGEWQKALSHFEIYQYLQDEPQRQVTGWIIDLKRRLQQETRVGAQP